MVTPAHAFTVFLSAARLGLEAKSKRPVRPRFASIFYVGEWLDGSRIC